MVKINDTVRLLTVGFMLKCAHLYYHENAYVFKCTLPIWICSAIKWFEFENLKYPAEYLSLECKPYTGAFHGKEFLIEVLRADTSLAHYGSALRWMLRDVTYDTSTLDQEMV